MIRRPFRLQYEPMILAGTKNHTVRPVPKRMPKIGEQFTGYIWTGQPYRSPQRTFFTSTVTKVEDIYINEIGIWIATCPLNSKEDEAFARADGFENLDEFLDFFRTVHGLPFTGIVIHWKPVPSHERNQNFVLAEEIRKDLMTMGGSGDVATRLALMRRQPDESEIELGGANEDCVRSIIFRHLEQRFDSR